jgi:hypothetical protein
MNSESGERLKKQKKNSSRMFEVFAGEYVTIVVKTIKGGSKGKIINLMLAGYLLDECENYVYIGENPHEIFACVKHNEIASIMMGDLSEAGVSLEIPEGSEIQ